MKLKNYTPAGKQIVCHLKQYAQIGSIITPDAQPDKVLRVVAVGDLCEKTKVDDYVLLQDRNYLQMEMADAAGKDITVLLATEFDIIGYYKPDEGETRYYIAIKKADGTVGNESRDMNIIDNPGIEHSPYLKEEAANTAALNS